MIYIVGESGYNGKWYFMIKVITGNITQLKVDAIVNAANRGLLGGGGVDGAIHEAAGPLLLQYCKTLQGCRTGEAKLSPAFELPARRIIHTVGPTWQGGDHYESKLLKACYQNSFEVALQNNVSRIAFPSISTGAYGYPKEQAASIAVTVMLAYEDRFDLIIACCFSESDATGYRASLDEARGESGC